MKAKSRKRLLISSVAMLLVAMLALGTATFAWFTSNTTATADTINASTSRISTLVLSDNTRTGWTTNLHYSNMTKTGIKPASSIDGSTWYSAVADDANSYAANAEGYSPIAANSLGDFVLVNELNIKNEGTATVEDVQITVNLTTTNDRYAYMALIPITVDNDPETPDTYGTFADNIYSNTAQSYKHLQVNSSTHAIEEATTDYTAIALKDASDHSVAIEVGDMDPDDINYYKLCVWFEGQDTDCKTKNSGDSITSLDFVVAPAPTP